MVKSVYVTGIGVPGKTVLIYGLMKIFKEKGFEVGYFKPVSRGINKVGPNQWIDDDVRALKEAFELKEETDIISPVVVRQRFLELFEKSNELLEKIKNAYDIVSKDKDAIFIESYGAPCHLWSIKLSTFTLASMLESNILFVIKGGGDRQVDEIVHCNGMFQDRGLNVIGVIFNLVEYHLVERVREFISVFLEKHNIYSYGIIPDKYDLMSPTLLDISSVLDAEVLEGYEKLDNLVEDFLVGAMGAEAALKWLRRSRRPVIITGGDRTELLLTALELKPSGIILTGNLYPALKVLTKARENEVPILLVPYDTFTTVEKLRAIHGRVTSYSLKKKEKIIVDTLYESLNVDKLAKDIMREDSL